MAKPKPEKSDLTENQLKVLRDKYLRDAPSVDAWLARVASNVALSEILLHPKAAAWGAFAGVNVARENGLTLFHTGLRDCETREANFQRLIGNLEKISHEIKEARLLHEGYSGRFFDLMRTWIFLPNSPTLMNAGRELQQLSACYVLPVEDSMEGITRALAAQSLIQKSGGGTGFAFSRLRPAGDAVKKTAGVASGALSFMRLFDTLTDVVKQGGARRGANMGVLHYTHPEIREFIALKGRPGVMENFNLSVGVDAAFMAAAEAGADYPLLNPRTGARMGTANAREVFDLICRSAWGTGDPGLIVLDRINASGSNPTPALGAIEATNPCGEQPLLPWEPCNLGSINLAAMVDGPTGNGRLDFERLRRVVADATRFLDDVIEINNYPLPEIEALAKGNRRVGLGVMGLAEALVKLGLPYDSPEALEFAEALMSRINAAALDASEELARQRGVFPNWKDSIYDEGGPHFRGQARRPRHCALTTIAPTGTIALAAGLQGSGIEPFFGIGYQRHSARALEALTKGREPEPNDVYIEVNPLFREIAENHDYFSLTENELWKRVDANGKSVKGIKEIPLEIQRLFPTAHDLPIEAHIRMQAAFQKHVDNGVSKTINLPAAATVSDVSTAYKLAYELGCKGITVYRDGSKAQQVLNLASKTSPSRRHALEGPFAAASEICPRCRSANVSHESGCSGPACHDCGYSQCS